MIYLPQIFLLNPTQRPARGISNHHCPAGFRKLKLFAGLKQGIPQFSALFLRQQQEQAGAAKSGTPSKSYSGSAILVEAGHF
jgi:hypothetical protein